MYKRFIQAPAQVLATGLIGLVKGYQYVVSPWLGNCCRFYPSCSSYAVSALQERGVIRGVGLIVWRLLRCHPLHPGGVDIIEKKET